ncbi:hypothetical protein FB45DRAFT_924095 [Roridomyces roridus]|uniref:Uncharacterized protein n=1 Tax=Roridomyces roridus TaxID=1738132 RepID=A0AAD7FKA9_9AGAR|nr:hypothetical protein FB45DRAFT_924095 [Roridomyces roridus]
MASQTLDASHPLNEELRSLRIDAERFQNEAHTASLKLQRHALDTSTLSERLAQLESDNARLRTELDVLRAHPATSEKQTQQEAVAAELTLSLRRLNTKLTLTENALAEATHAHAVAVGVTAVERHKTEEAYAAAVRARGREEEARVRVRELEIELAGAREEGRMSERAVEEYAALVRRLERRQPMSPRANGNGKPWADGSSTTLVDPAPTPEEMLAAQKAHLAPLLSSFADSAVAAEARLAELQNEADVKDGELKAVQALVEELGAELAKAKFEREVGRVEDSSAAGMVERYMKFTQQTTTALHASLSSLRARHAATLATLQAELAEKTERADRSERREREGRTRLDEAGRREAIASVGRRREVALRVRLVGREARVVENLKRAVGRVAHSNSASSSEDLEAGKAIHTLLADVHGVLKMLDSPSMVDVDVDADAGSEGRMCVLEGAVEMLVKELEGEVGRRVKAEAEKAEESQEGKVDDNSTPPPPLPPKPVPELAIPTPQISLPSPSVDDTPITPMAELEVHQPSPRLPPSRLLEDFEEEEEEMEDALEDEGATVDDEGAPSPALETALDDGTSTFQLPASDEAAATPASPTTDSVVFPVSALSAAVPDESTASSAAVASVVFPSTDGGFPAGEPTTDSVVLPISASATPQAAVASVVFPSPESGFSAGEPKLEEPQAPSNGVVFPGSATQPLASSNGIVFPVADPDTPTNPLLADLAAARQRYASLQRAFLACHRALEDLRTALAGGGKDKDLALRGAVERLHDYTEDARVELEIRVADERVLARGWETLVGLSPEGGEKEKEEGEAEKEVRAQVAAFVERDGQAHAGFMRKLEDVEHDIGAVKRVVYAPPAEAVVDEQQQRMKEREKEGGWGSWLRSGTPSPDAFTPTFGSVMTSPRLRHSTSAARLGPLEGLGLRVAMPAYVAPVQQVEEVRPRQRTISGVYMLGLGVGHSPGRGRRPSALGVPPVSVDDASADVE